jgi:light-regulated signal transduction histidine kinase (bacteriophytochrome)
MEYHERYLALKEELYNMEKTVALERIMLESEASREKMKGRLLKIKNNEVQRYAKKLEQSNSDLRQFAQIASHDLKEPLRTMHMYMTLLERRLGNADEEMSEYFGYVKSSSERLYNLVSDLMVFTKMESEPRRTNVIEMNEVMKDAMANLGALIERSGAKIVYGSLPSVKGTRFELVQLLQNLISNGIKYNQSKEPLINIKSKVRTNEVEFCIGDNGIGIEESYWKKVFQIFQRLHYSEQHPGTGIGLAFCKKIVENHGGKIWLKSEPGVGSRFYFILPKS